MDVRPPLASKPDMLRILLDDEQAEEPTDDGVPF